MVCGRGMPEVFVDIFAEAWRWMELSVLFLVQAAAEIERRSTLVAVLLSLFLGRNGGFMRVRWLRSLSPL